MNHIDDDTILKYALEIIEDIKEKNSIEEHLVSCPECRQKLIEIRKDMDIIRGIQSLTSELKMPVPKKRGNILLSTMRVASLIILGIAIGFSSAKLSDNEQVSVRSSYNVISPLADSLIGFAPSDATEISFRSLTNN